MERDSAALARRVKEQRLREQQEAIDAKARAAKEEEEKAHRGVLAAQRECRRIAWRCSPGGGEHGRKACTSIRTKQ